MIATGGPSLYEMFKELNERVKLIEAWLDGIHQDEGDFGIMATGDITLSAGRRLLANRARDRYTYGTGGSVSDVRYPAPPPLYPNLRPPPPYEPLTEVKVAQTNPGAIIDALNKPVLIDPLKCAHVMKETFDTSPSVTICRDCGTRFDSEEARKGVHVMDLSPPEAPIPVEVRLHEDGLSRYVFTPRDLIDFFKSMRG